MSIPYFGKNGPITSKELFDYYINDFILLNFLIAQEPYESEQPTTFLTTPIIDKEPVTKTNNIQKCRDCCRKKVMGTRKTSCPYGYIPPLSDPCTKSKYSGCLDTRTHPAPKTTSPPYPRFPWCCDPTTDPDYYPLQGRRHNEPNDLGRPDTQSRYVRAMESCLRRKGITSTRTLDGPTGVQRQVDECLAEIQKMWDEQKIKDDQCVKDDIAIRACISECLASNTASPCTPASTQTQ
jgi:hypothetical protein